MKREKLKHLKTTGMIEEKLRRGKEGEKILHGLTRLLNVGLVTDALKVRE